MNDQLETSADIADRARQAIQIDRMLGIDEILARPPARPGSEGGHAATMDATPVPAPRTRPSTPAPEPKPIPDPNDGGGPPRVIAASTTGVGDIDGTTPAERLASLKARHDVECQHCSSSDTHANTVFGEGAPSADLMFIGEAPGAEEDRTGRPFVGPAGQKLDEMIKAMGFEREDVYIANVLKSRPPNNRTPLEHEIASCSPYLAEQVGIIQPKVIVTLGGPAAKLLLSTEKGITRLRGIWGQYQVGSLVVPVMPTFHPAYLLRNYTHEVRSQVWNDLQSAVKKITEQG